ncbi:cytosolic carboxypeptidase 1-like isoform X2 [Limulus polyphemus]|uniref:tubulin-glutamate carboxypeptidase n=1 Tax=Limulus polyphemus TaxID=6850 RepID=A0ABM1C2W2_LIMPO|nr:cytosolic carboxypeptidase 1-like isoform X2 [Limulus polyphemus]
MSEQALCRSNCQLLVHALVQLSVNKHTASRRWRKEKTKRAFISLSCGVIPVLTSILQQTQDHLVVQNIVLLFHEVLSSKTGRVDVAITLVSHDTIRLLLEILGSYKGKDVVDDDHLLILYGVLAKIGHYDKKFGVKVRLSNVLKLTVNFMRTYKKKTKCLQNVLSFLSLAMKNTTNACLLGKEGLIPLLLSLIGGFKRKPSLTNSYAMEALAGATRSRQNALQVIHYGGIATLLLLLDPSSWVTASKKGRRMLRIFKAVLQVLLHLSVSRAGRQALTEINALSALLAWCYALPNSDESWDHLVVQASTIIQRCLPPLTLNIISLHHPVSFPLPEEEIIPKDFENPGVGEFLDDESVSSSSDDETSDQEDTEVQVPCEALTDQPNTEDLKNYSKFFSEITSKHIERIPTYPAQTGNTVEGDEMTDVIFSNEKSHLIVTNDREQLNNKFSEKTFAQESSNQGKILLNSAKQIKQGEDFLEKMNFWEVYEDMTSRTLHQIPFVKIAYPEMKGDPCRAVLEPLNTQKTGISRNKLLTHVENRLNYSCSDELLMVYDLDQLLCDENSQSETFQGLKNNDEERVLQQYVGPNLKFESRFESGNLRKAIKVKAKEYDLILNSDMNTDYHHQWFYFEVSGMEAYLPYTFNIINCEKSSSIFTGGMCPVLFSVKESMLGRGKWVRTGSNIAYYRNHYIRKGTISSILRGKPYYTLSFTVSFAHAGDVCYLAYHYPYTYSLLQTHLYCLENSYDTTMVYFKKQDLCTSMTGNPVPLLTITAQPPDALRPYVFLTGRVHPGESNSSWAMKGTVDFLLGNKPSAQRLREMMIFKVVPMLNPDGVINGSYRCSLSGEDLNRQWLSPNRKLHPSIFHTKALFYYLKSMEKTPLLYCDYHGHSRRKNVFLYGCSPSQSWWSCDREKPDNHSYESLPVLLHHMAPAFNLENCNFAVERNREGTGRVTVWRQFGVAMSYTMECTYGGCDQGIYAGYHLNANHLEEMGIKFCQALGKLWTGISKAPGWSSVNLIIDSFLLGNNRLYFQEEKSVHDVHMSSNSSQSDEEFVEDDEDEAQT